ncbi:MAG: class I SAM-dependent methyltransferase [Leptospiraceae bacterium]|nr:class I SAM-dependent methyltransferase [Leptospiraceae bacterium]NUM41786.1 class I SAM-dependent methyltransferase [Leptospiraceae bacterium]
MKVPDNLLNFKKFRKLSQAQSYGDALGANGKQFDVKYWSEIYGSGEDVDGTFNAKEHALYLKSILKLFDIPVRSLADFGFGKGFLLQRMIQAFQPGRVFALDTSKEMVERLKNSKWIHTTNIAVNCGTIQSINTEIMKYAPYDLGIFNSVLQYIKNEDIEIVLEKISKITKYLYFSVPTKNDYTRMKKEIYFEDPYAFARTKNFYMKKISKFFTIVSYNLLESKVNISDSNFNDEIFRF